MFRNSLVLAAALIALGAHAQSTSQAMVSAESSPQNIGNPTVNFNSAAPLPYVEGRSTFSTNQASQNAPSFATPAVWRCSTSGWGAAGNVVGGGLSLAGPGGESELCATEFRMTMVKYVASTSGDERTAAIRLACGDEKMADAMEGTKNECPAPQPGARKQRWERSAKAEAVLDGKVASLNLLP